MVEKTFTFCDRCGEKIDVKDYDPSVPIDWKEETDPVDCRTSSYEHCIDICPVCLRLAIVRAVRGSQFHPENFWPAFVLSAEGIKLPDRWEKYSSVEEIRRNRKRKKSNTGFKSKESSIGSGAGSSC